MTLLENVNELEPDELELFFVFRSFIYGGNPETHYYAADDVLEGRAGDAFAQWVTRVAPKLTRAFTREERSR